LGFTIKQCDGAARLQPQNLHVARGARWQFQQRAGYQGAGAVKTWHLRGIESYDLKNSC